MDLANADTRAETADFAVWIQKHLWRSCGGVRVSSADDILFRAPAIRRRLYQMGD